jgi:hypothetical protein
MDRWYPETVLIEARQPTAAERTVHGAEVVFVRQERGTRRRMTIYACDHKQHGSWEQWGAIAEVLSDNVPAVECWHRGGLYYVQQMIEEEVDDV